MKKKKKKKNKKVDKKTIIKKRRKKKSKRDKMKKVNKQGGLLWTDPGDVPTQVGKGGVVSTWEGSLDVRAQTLAVHVLEQVVGHGHLEQGQQRVDAVVVVSDWAVSLAQGVEGTVCVDGGKLAVQHSDLVLQLVERAERAPVHGVPQIGVDAVDVQPLQLGLVLRDLE